MHGLKQHDQWGPSLNCKQFQLLNITLGNIQARNLDFKMWNMTTLLCFCNLYASPLS